MEDISGTFNCHHHHHHCSSVSSQNLAATCITVAPPRPRLHHPLPSPTSCTLLLLIEDAEAPSPVFYFKSKEVRGPTLFYSLAWMQFELILVSNLSLLLLFLQCKEKEQRTLTSALFLQLNFSGGVKVKICGVIQYLNLFGVAIGYTIAASISMM